MLDKRVQVNLSQSEALVLFELLARLDKTESITTEHSAEQKLLWLLEGQLEKQLPVFASDYKQVLKEARNQVDSDL